MALLQVYKRNLTFMDMFDLAEEISSSGLDETLRKYYNKPVEKNLKSIVAGPIFQ
jgi:hypothetical protein